MLALLEELPAECLLATLIDSDLAILRVSREFRALVASSGLPLARFAGGRHGGGDAAAQACMAAAGMAAGLIARFHPQQEWTTHEGGELLRAVDSVGSVARLGWRVRMGCLMTRCGDKA